METIKSNQVKRKSVLKFLENGNDDGDGNENGKKAICLDKQNDNFARASRFFVNFSAVVARLQRETASFHVLSRTGTKRQQFSFSFPEL